MTSYLGRHYDHILGRHYDRDAIMTVSCMTWGRHYDRVSWDAIMNSYPGTPL